MSGSKGGKFPTSVVFITYKMQNWYEGKIPTPVKQNGLFWDYHKQYKLKFQVFGQIIQKVHLYWDHRRHFREETGANVITSVCQKNQSIKWNKWLQSVYGMLKTLCVKENWCRRQIPPQNSFQYLDFDGWL